MLDVLVPLFTDRAPDAGGWSDFAFLATIFKVVFIGAVIWIALYWVVRLIGWFFR